MHIIHEIKRHLLLGRQVMTNLDSIFKRRDITLPTKVHLVKAMVFPVVMYGCESWTVKKAERRKIVAFELWYWRRLLRVPWTARRSNQSILKKISPECSLEGLILKLKLQYFGHLMQALTHWKRPWCWEGLGAGGEGDDRGWDGWMASPTRWTWVWVNSGSWWWTGRPSVLWFVGLQRVRHNWATKLKRTELKPILLSFVRFQLKYSPLTEIFLNHLFHLITISGEQIYSHCNDLNTIGSYFRSYFTSIEKWRQSCRL